MVRGARGPSRVSSARGDQSLPRQHMEVEMKMVKSLLLGTAAGLVAVDRNQPRGRPEEKTFHHLHLNLHMLSWEGLISSGAAHPGRSPGSPHHPLCPLPRGP